MNKSPEIYWKDKSGIRHRFWIYPRGTKFNEPCPGIYIYARETSAHKWIPIYIGQTENVNVRLTDQEQQERVDQHGATHIHVSIIAREKARRTIEKDLIQHWNPVCNTPCASTPRLGLTVEEVADVNPDFVVRDRNGEIHAVRYDATRAMLLDEFLKEHRKVEKQGNIIAQVKSTAAKQEAIIAELKSGIQALTARVKEQASQIQRANAALGLSRFSPQLTGHTIIKTSGCDSPSLQSSEVYKLTSRMAG
ncbi:MAG TPA: hypothetical protein VFA61_13070 [Candidatus Udaeobacter sp.]|nr:hypothetical protein [Candidatus Udaeobacter sp.]